MIKVVLTDEIKKYHEKYFEDNIKPNFEINKINMNKSDLKKHEKFMCFCSDNYKNFAIGDINKLRELYKEIEEKHKSILKMIKYNTKNVSINKSKQSKTYKNYLLGVFGYDKFVNRTTFDVTKNDITIGNYDNYSSRDSWNPYMFVFMLGIRVCPYCNRQYVTPVYSSSGKLRADLDHFLPKNKYPFFSMSLYNLIPSCKFCNSSLKGRKEFDFDSLNPYECNIDDYIKFEMNISSNFDNESYIFANPIKEEKKAKEYLNMFKIETLYNYHRNQASDLLKKKLIYSDEYIENMYKHFGDHFYNIDEMKELIIGYTGSKDKINDEPLAKFKRDISKQLGFIEEVDKDTIDKLKLLHASITE